MPRHLVQICEAEGIEILKGVVSSDHVHTHIQYAPKLNESYILKQMKGRTSRKLQQEFPAVKDRYGGDIFGKTDMVSGVPEIFILHCFIMAQELWECCYYAKLCKYSLGKMLLPVPVWQLFFTINIKHQKSVVGKGLKNCPAGRGAGQEQELVAFGQYSGLDLRGII